MNRKCRSDGGLGNNRTGIGKLNNREISGGGEGNDIEVLLESLLSFPKKKKAIRYVTCNVLADIAVNPNAETVESNFCGKEQVKLIFQTGM